MQHHELCPPGRMIVTNVAPCPVCAAIRAAVEAATKDLEAANARLTANRCACDVDAPGDVCLMHQRKIDAAVEAERDKIAKFRSMLRDGWGVVKVRDYFIE